MSIPDEGERAKIIERLKTVALERVAAQAAVDSKKAVIAKIAAVRETQGGSNALKLLDGTLRRGGCPPLNSLVGKAKHEIEAVFAASKSFHHGQDGLQVDYAQVGNDSGLI